MREDRTTLPESEKNAPEDTAMGWKDFVTTQKGTNNKVTVQRFWTGRQWSDTFKEKDISNV